MKMGGTFYAICRATNCYCLKFVNDNSLKDRFAFLKWQNVAKNCY